MKIPIVNEQGEVIGSEERSVVHQKGLLHPEVFVIIELPNGKLVFQKRATNKETNPGKLTLSATGHVELSQTPEEAAIAELYEETGIKESIENLKFVDKFILKTEDSLTDTINYSIRYCFSYKYSGKLSDLKVEEGAGAGFEEYYVSDVLNLSEEEKSKFVKVIFSPQLKNIFEKLNLCS